MAPWFSIAARDAMDGVGGCLFDKAQFGGEQTAPARHQHALSQLGSVVRARNELGQFVQTPAIYGIPWAPVDVKP